MMIDFGKAEIFKRQVPQAVEGGVDIDGAGAHIFQSSFRSCSLIHMLLS